jgi:hypothetical protein
MLRRQTACRYPDRKVKGKIPEAAEIVDRNPAPVLSIAFDFWHQRARCQVVPKLRV